MRVVQTTQFKKDKKQRKRGSNFQELKTVIDLLIASDTLPARNRDHALTGKWIGWRDCHLEPDWILIYKVTEDEILLGRTENHFDLF